MSQEFLLVGHLAFKINQLMAIRTESNAKTLEVKQYVNIEHHI